jgi:hypothetical protein
MTRLLAIALAACLCSGCFIFEELDKGQKYMDDHSPTRNEHARAKRGRRGGEPVRDEANGDASGGIRERIQIALSRVPDALAGLKEILSWRGDEDGKGSSRGERDPRDAMVRCVVAGGMLFTSRIECEGRGGEVLGEAGLPAEDA